LTQLGFASGHFGLPIALQWAAGLTLKGVHAILAEEITTSRPKLVLDEAAFQQLLAAAHVLQQHSDRLQTREVFLSSTEILSEIVDTQKRIHTGRLSLAVATGLITERLLRITGCGGVAVALLDGERLAYIAASGTASGELGRRIPLSTALSGECISKGKILRYSDLAQDRPLCAEMEPFPAWWPFPFSTKAESWARSSLDLPREMSSASPTCKPASSWQD
jgi:hypothetical protein